jgi:hypothetical protein
MTFQGFFQQGYITHDLDRAIASTGPLLGSGRFSAMEVELPLATPAGAASLHVRVATGWAGRVQIELIQPLGGATAVYERVLPPDPTDFTPRFHHVAMRRDDRDAMHREVEALGFPVVFETEGSGISSIFVDARSRIGHHLEFVCASLEGWVILGFPPSF